jgi:DNA-binding LytR/AlgR family response regulator
MAATKILTLRNEHEFKCIDLSKLLFICADNYLCNFYLENEQKFTCTKSLTEIESVLPDHFFRINRSCIINIYSVDTINLRDRTLLLSNSAKFIVSHRKIRQFHITLTSFNNTPTG